MKNLEDAIRNIELFLDECADASIETQEPYNSLQVLSNFVNSLKKIGLTLK